MGHSRGLWWLLIPVAMGACSDPEVPATVTAGAGAAGQSAVVGTAVGTRPSVTVTSDKGTPLPGVPVTFAVASGGGQVTGGAAVSGQDGVATVGEWILGNLVGPNTLTATVTTLAPVTFTATGTPGPAATAEKIGDNQSAVVGATEEAIVNAMVAAEGVIVPVQCEYLSLRGLAQLRGTLAQVRENLNPTVDIVGILPTMYDGRTVHCREAVQMLTLIALLAWRARSADRPIRWLEVSGAES